MKTLSQRLYTMFVCRMFFVHEPSGVWAAYNDVDSGFEDFGAFSDGFGGQTCYSRRRISSIVGTDTDRRCSAELFSIRWIGMVDLHPCNGTNGYGRVGACKMAVVI